MLSASFPNGEHKCPPSALVSYHREKTNLAYGKRCSPNPVCSSVNQKRANHHLSHGTFRYARCVFCLNLVSQTAVSLLFKKETASNCQRKHVPLAHRIC